MMTRYRLTAPIPAIRHPPAGAEIADRRVKLPAGAMLYVGIRVEEDWILGSGFAPELLPKCL
jgi:hypothetical protein